MGKTAKIIILVTAAVVAAIIGVAIYMTVDNSIAEDKDFDYVNSNLSNYVSFSEKDYKNYEMEIDIAKPKDIDPDVAILSLLAASKGAVLNDGAAVTSPVTVKAGDVVFIWFRGYLLDTENNKVYLPGMSNLTGKEAQSLEIGSGNFVPGFELSLVGKNTGNYPKFTKITEGTVKSGQVAYVSYSRLVEGGDAEKDKKTGNSVRIDLSDETVEETFGKGFKDGILGAKIGEVIEFDVTLDGKKHTYSATSVDFVTECEVDPLVIECYFPYDYGTANLRNETAYFEVYIEKVQQYESPEFNDEFVLNTINAEGSAVTLEMLNEYEGDSLTEKLRAYIEKAIYDEYEENYKALVEEKMWDHYLETAKVKRYPGKKVEEVYDEYVEDVYYQYDQTGGSLQNSYTEEYEYYEDIETFAVAYLGLTYAENQDWRDVLYEMSQNLIKERLILYYLLDVAGLTPTEAELKSEYEAVRQEYLDEYILQYLEYENKTRADYTDEEYDEFVEARKKELFDYYDEDYFMETAYYEIGLREFVKWPKVSTLDDRRAYKFD